MCDQALLVKYQERLGHPRPHKLLMRECHQLQLGIAHRIGAQIIGVNNRNLVTFEVDINTSLELSTHFRDDKVYISESGIFTGQDSKLVAPYFNAILVGTALMQADNVADKVKELAIDKG